MFDLEIAYNNYYLYNVLKKYFIINFVEKHVIFII